MPKKSYYLLFEQDPWGCQIIRAGEVIIQLLTDYRNPAVKIAGQQHEFKFDGSLLNIEDQGPKIRFQWQGPGIQLRIPMHGWWYGGGELINQPLTWNQTMFSMTEYITWDNGETGLSTLLSPIWLSSLGLALKINSPFSIGVNQPPAKYLRRQKGMSPDLIPFAERPFLDLKGEGDGQISLLGDDLNFEVLIEEDIVTCCRSLVRDLGLPQNTPPLELMGAPIWTTWARYKDLIDQELILEFAREIIENDYPYHVLEIDDRWQTKYGDLEFDPLRFPDPKRMIQELHKLGFKVTAWVIPFFQIHSRSGVEAAENGFLVRTPQGKPYPVKWWQGRGYLLDVTNPEALAWFGKRLTAFQAETGLDGYKFDAGEGKYAPRDAVYKNPMVSPNDYTHMYIQWIAENFSFCEVRSGWMNQSAPIFFRLWDLWSVWGYDNGLRSIIPSTLALSLTGYPFVFPDMIGGNAYFTFPKNRILSWILQRIVVPLMENRVKNKSEFPEEETLSLGDVPDWMEKSTTFGYPTPELMIRWAQANVFLGVMQFSLAPWDFGPEANRICREAARLHLEFVPVLQKFAREALKTEIRSSGRFSGWLQLRKKP